MNYFQKLINFAYKLYLPLPIRSSYFLYFSYLNIFFCRTVHWILVPWSGIEPMPLQWQCPVLTPGPSGKPLCPLFPQQWHTAAGLCSVKANCLWPHGPQQAPLSMGVPRQGHWSGLPFLLQRIFLTQGLNPCLWCLLHWQVDFFFFNHCATWEAQWHSNSLIFPYCSSLCLHDYHSYIFKIKAFFYSPALIYFLEYMPYLQTDGSI